MSDLLFQQLSTVQSNQQLMPVTLASALTVAPTTFITYVTGTVDVKTVTPPVTGSHMLVMVFTDVSPPDILTTGNVTAGLTTIAANAPVLLFWNPISEIYITLS